MHFICMQLLSYAVSSLCSTVIIRYHSSTWFQVKIEGPSIGLEENALPTCHLSTVSGQHLVFFPFLRTNFTLKLRILI